MTPPLTPDPAMLQALERAGGPALVAALLRSFVEKSPGRLAELRDRLAAGHAADAGRIAHTMKSSAGQLGMTVLQQACQAFETAAEPPGTGAAALPELLAQIEKAFYDYREWADAVRREPAP